MVSETVMTSLSEKVGASFVKSPKIRCNQNWYSIIRVGSMRFMVDTISIQFGDIIEHPH